MKTLAVILHPIMNDKKSEKKNKEIKEKTEKTKKKKTEKTKKKTKKTKKMSGKKRATQIKYVWMLLRSRNP